MQKMNEVEQIKQRYAKRTSMGDRYSMLWPSVYMAMPRAALIPY